jgi:hypothetical protein
MLPIGLWRLYINITITILFDRLCGLVVRVLGYRSEGPGSIPGTTRFSGGKKKKPVVGTTEELLKSSGSCLENREYGRRDPPRWPRGTLYPQKLALTSPTSGGLSVGIVRSRTQTMDFFYHNFICLKHYVSETGFCLHLQVEPTQVGPVDRASLYLRTQATTPIGFIKTTQRKPPMKVNISTPWISIHVWPKLSLSLSLSLSVYKG